MPLKGSAGQCNSSLPTHRALNLYDDMANISAQCCPHLCQFQQDSGWGGGSTADFDYVGLYHVIFTAVLSNGVAKDRKTGKKAEELWLRIRSGFLPYLEFL